MMRSPRTVALSLCVIGGLAFQIGLRAQAARSPVHVRILMAGGLLGQEDGMPEYPGGPFDTAVGPGMRPYGGLAGLLDWVQKDRTRARPDMFLMTGNNLPREIGGGDEVIAFFQRVRDLQPSAIAVGVEDFLRGLGGEHSHTGALLATRMRETDLPFLLTNAAVRLHQAGLNKIAQNGFRLNVDPDSSIGWVRDLSVTYPCGLTATLKAGVDITVSRADGPDPARGRLRFTMNDKKPCSIRVSLPSWLSPGATYDVEIKNDAPLAKFTVHTDQRLTRETAIVPDRTELPIVVALVDPHVRDILRKAKWRWRAAKDAKCDVAECEILILPPADALDAALGAAELTPTLRPVALLSNLEDKDTAAVLQRNPRVRIVVLPADSLALGRASLRNLGGASPADRYSGDLGYGAVLNSNTPTATQIWSRPEWFAESIHAIDMDINPETWGFSKTVQESFSVKGRALCARPTGQKDEVGYYLRDWRIENGRTVYENPSPVAVSKAPFRYAGLEPGAPDGAAELGQGNVWTNLDSFAAVALDAMREDFNADLAVLPASAIDDNWLTYLRDDPSAPTQWPSKVLLERLVFRAGTIVKVRLSKADLFKKLPALVAATKQAGGTSCLSGLGIATCGSADLREASTFINDRRADKNRFYTIALPESVALENDLTRYGDAEADLLYMMDRVFMSSKTSPPDTCSASDSDGASAPQAQPARRDQGLLGTRLERVRAARNSPYLFVKPAEFSFSQILVDEPAGGQGLLNKLTVPNSGAKPSRRTSVKADADYGILDTPQYALRALGSMAYGRAQVNAQSSTDPNLAKLGGRFDWKVRHRGRAFGGYSWETQFANQVTPVTPSSKGIAGPTLSLVTLRRDYRFVTGGFELENPKLTRWLSLEPLSISVAVGTSAYEHVDIAVDGDRLGLAAFQKLGATGLLNQYFSTHPELAATSHYAFIDEPQRRTRVQIDVTPRIALPFPGRSLDLTLETSFRRFVGPNLMPLAERQSATTKVTLAIPLYGLATLNLNTAASFSQVNGVNGWFRVVQPSISFGIPLIGSRHAGWVF